MSIVTGPCHRTGQKFRLAVLCACAAFTLAPGSPLFGAGVDRPTDHSGLIFAAMDRSVRPQDDFYSYANGIFSSRRIERASYRDIAVRFVAANLHPDHDTIAEFRRSNKVAIEAAFLQVLLLARETGLLRLGTVSIDGTKLDANASKIRSVRYDRAKQLRARLAADIATLTAQAEAADAENRDPQALPVELARREVLKAKLDAACARLEAEAGGSRGRPASV